MQTILAVVALAIVFPLVLRLADKLGDWSKVMSVLKRINAI